MKKNSLYGETTKAQPVLLSVLIAMLLILAACGETVSVSEGMALVGAADTECETGFYLFDHAAGQTCIPEDPQRIVTITDQNALLPLLELGVTPVGSTGRTQRSGIFNRNETGIFRRMDGFDTTGIEFLGDWTQPNIEEIIALEPDLIVGYEGQLNNYEEFSVIAPTVLIQIFERPLDEALMDFARLANAEEEGAAFRTVYQEQVDRVLTGLGERHSEITVVILNPINSNEYFRVYESGQTIGTVSDALAINGMVATSQEEFNAGTQSMEAIDKHMGDVVLVLDYSIEDSDSEVGKFINSPLLMSQPTAQAGQVYRLDGSRTVGSAWVRMQNFLDVLEEILLDPDLNIDLVTE